ncbi:MAG: biopolymer transporter ExbD [Aphanocapsa lilacina HA4352-LM1]|jgi:biopolymer transport protein ExbD|uniref:ExbD/TolR family protein n=2 Tax=Gloeobacter TaxID=33071 RepID=Q7NLI3_GLOVI|nr:MULTISPECIES: biopolymer transporter ExbD [Gloeobacter]MBW4698853.1 biopolymer transporter ExbD [Aphanocapsa lilacina HA4352-LM1]UFP94946.1 biopolymer transporter ExbD [Gloeobacter morelensis MG652769]BAC89081.1 ExbD/TolR family protein [Gloeobacter violaceus PCC 7421]
MAIQAGGSGRGRRNRSGFTEINITPLTDVFLVLVIILLITAPLIQNNGLKVDLPTSATGDKPEQKKSLVVGVDKDGKYSVNGAVVPEANLLAALRREAESSGQKVLVVQADADARQKNVVKVMDAARQAGLEKLVVATQPSGG